LNLLVGNGDAHAKNFSLLHHASGALTLAPLYDLMCTQHYGDDRLAMYIDTVQRTSRVTAERIANEAVRWGISRDRASRTIGGILREPPRLWLRRAKKRMAFRMRWLPPSRVR